MQNSNLEEVTVKKRVLFRPKKKKISNCVTEHSFCSFRGHNHFRRSAGRTAVAPGDTTYPGVNLEALPVSQLCKASVKKQVQGSGGYRARSWMCVITAETGMNGKAALCGAVLISCALKMKKKEKLPSTPTTRQREGLAVVEKVQNVLTPLRKCSSLCFVPVFL